MRLLGFIALLLLATPVVAQEVPLTDATVSVTAPSGPIAATGATAVNGTVAIGCGALIQHAAGGSLTISSADAAAVNLTVDPATVPIAPDQECLTGQGTKVFPFSVDVTPMEGATGLTDLTFMLNATLSGATGVPGAATVQVAYLPCHSISHPDGSVFDVSGETLRFNLTMEFCANANSMIMFEKQVATAGSISGLQPIIRTPPATETIEVTFTAPSGKWTEANFTFENFSHFIDPVTGAGGDPMLVSNPVWTFRNAGGPASSDDGKDSPGLGFVLVGAVLAGAFLARRR